MFFQVNSFTDKKDEQVKFCPMIIIDQNGYFYNEYNFSCLNVHYIYAYLTEL